jgi:phenylacetate-coenzyme A ligase PaaK-like adenylate-forming protein
VQHLSADDLRRIGAEVQERIKVLIGVSVNVSVLPFATLERMQAGKAKRVIDLRTLHGS